MVVAVMWLEVVGDAVTVVHGEDVQDGLPAADLAGEVLAVLLLLGGDEVAHFKRGLFSWEVAAVLHGSPEPSVQRLDRVCRVLNFAELGRELEERKGTNSPQDRSHDAIIAGYMSRYSVANSANSSSAAGTVGAV